MRTANDGENAIATFLHHRDIKLVFSYIGLPKIGGIDLSETFKRLNPEVKIILASGFIETEEKQSMLKQGVSRFVEKPYKMSQVL